jgi:hypothetical protein
VAIGKGKSEAGQGGKRGHSNMDHWDYTEAIKEAARKQRRLEAKIQIKDGLDELEATDTPESPKSNVSDELPE